MRHRVVRRQHLAQRRGVQRLHGAHLQHLPAVVGPEDVVDDQHALLVQHAQVDALAAGAGQVVRPDQGAGPQLVDVQIAVAQPQQLRAQLVAARRRRPARRSPPPGGCAGCRGRCPWRGPATRRCRTGRAGARRPRAAAASRPPVRATGCSVPSPSCLRPLDRRFDNAEHYRSMPTSVQRSELVVGRTVARSPVRRRRPARCRPPRGTPRPRRVGPRLRWPRAPSDRAGPQSRQPSHSREHIHGLVAADPFRRPAGPDRRAPRGSRHPCGGRRRCDGHDAPGAGPHARGLRAARGLQRDPQRHPPRHRPLGPRGVLRGRRRLRRDQHLRREPRGAGGVRHPRAGPRAVRGGCPDRPRGGRRVRRRDRPAALGARLDGSRHQAAHARPRRRTPRCATPTSRTPRA